jgi:dienelactone hydrolase
MSIDGRGETTPKVSRRRQEHGFLGRLRSAAMIAVRAGAVGSVGLMLWVGHRNPSRLLLVLFAIWVLSPFVALVLAHVVSKSWSVITQATLYTVTLVLTLASLAIYAAVAWGPPRAQAAFVFILVPPASWLFVAIVIPITAVISGRLSPVTPMLEKRARPSDWIFKGIAGLATLCILGVGALVGSLWLEKRTEITLPTPTGPFVVGRTIYDWIDEGKLDTLAPVPGTKRELLVWMWYPAAAEQSVEMDDYVPAQMRAAAGPASGLFRFLTRDESKVHGHSRRNSDLSGQQHSYPVVIMRAGASAGVVGCSTLAEDLASHGYIVVGFDAPYRTGIVVFPDGRVMRRTPENNPELCAEKEQAQQAGCMSRLLAAWTGDIAFVLDELERLNTSDASGRLTGRLDMTRVGVFGHSFGGGQAAQFCHEDARCKAGIDVDGQPFGSVVQAGLHQPFMFLLSDHGNSSDPVSRQIEANIQSIYDRLPEDKRLRIAVRGANHFMFSDDGALLKSYILRWTLRVFGKLGIDGRRQLAVTAYCVHSFFDVYLKGESVSRLRISSPLYPEIQVPD